MHRAAQGAHLRTGTVGAQQQVLRVAARHAHTPGLSVW